MENDIITCPTCGMTFRKSDFVGDNWEEFGRRIRCGLNGNHLVGKLREIRDMIDGMQHRPDNADLGRWRSFVMELKVEVEIELERIENCR